MYHMLLGLMRFWAWIPSGGNPISQMNDNEAWTGSAADAIAVARYLTCAGSRSTM